jgi:hypothetical protein
MKIELRACSIVVVACISLTSNAAMAEETLTVTPIALGQSAVDGRFVNAKIRVSFHSFFGIGEVTYGGGFTITCPSSTIPTPPVKSQVHLDPLFPWTVTNETMDIGSPPYDIPGFDSPGWGNSQICRMVYGGAANFDNFPLNIGVNLPETTISITSQRIDLHAEDFAPFSVTRGSQTCPGNQLPTPDGDPACDPLILDLGQDGIMLGPKGVGVYFDNDGNGLTEHFQWVRNGGNEAFLVVDKNGNGIIDNGTELFGNGTVLTLEGSVAPNGFVALAQYDDPRLGGNDDGYITSADAVWSQLLLWLDSDADGRSAAHEITKLGSTKVIALPTIPRNRMYQDEAGNVIPYHASAITSSRPNRMQMIDVYFRNL